MQRVEPPIAAGKNTDGSMSFEWSLPLRWNLIIHAPKGDSGVHYSSRLPLSEHESRIVIIKRLDKGGKCRDSRVDEIIRRIIANSVEQ